MYSREANGEVLEFGTSGLLYESNKLMYDRGTDTLWQSFYGEPNVGPLADSGIKLDLLPVLVTTWGEWLEAHPDTTVLDDDTGVYPATRYLPEENLRSMYADYRADPRTRFPVAKRSDLLATKTQVLGLNIGGSARAYPLETLRENLVINDSLGGTDVVIVTKAEAGAARPYEGGSHQFALARSGWQRAGSGLPGGRDGGAVANGRGSAGTRGLSLATPAPDSQPHVLLVRVVLVLSRHRRLRPCTGVVVPRGRYRFPNRFTRNRSRAFRLMRMRSGRPLPP